MIKFKLLAVAAVAAIGAAGCASSSGSSDNRTASAPAASSSAAVARTELAPQQPAATTGFSDAQLQSFAAASLEIDPISRGLAGATPDQQATAATQIRAILERHNLDGNTYNAIASQAQTDAVLAGRIAAAQTAAMPQSETGDAPAEEPGTAPTTP